MENEPKIEQPGIDSQRTYASMRDNDATVVSIVGTSKKYKIRWIKNGQIINRAEIIIGTVLCQSMITAVTPLVGCP